MCSTRPPRRRQRGVTTVEFALVAVTFFTMLIGAFEVGRLLYGLSAISNAAREGARYGIALGNPVVTPPGDSACGSGPAMDQAAKSTAQGIGTLNVTATEDSTKGTCTVTVTWQYKPASGFFTGMRPATFSSTAVQYFYYVRR